MNAGGKSAKITIKLAIAAIFAALVYVATTGFVAPIPATSGYFNLGETMIYVAALVFGPYVGAFAGGIGAATADMFVAPQFAWGTFVIKGIEGIIVGFLNRKIAKITPKFNIGAIIATIIGGLEMVAGYFLYEQLFLGMGEAAYVEIPVNIVQMLIGLAIAFPIATVISFAFPQLKN